jgi:AcrR family transcriptional regulator
VFRGCLRRNNTKRNLASQVQTRAVDLDRRERKKLRTREAIQNAAFELFAERGYRETTIAAIAERADVAPRTVTVHFPTKEELLFDYEPFGLESLSERLRSRQPGETALEALREWMATTMTTVAPSGQLDESSGNGGALRARVIVLAPSCGPPVPAATIRTAAGRSGRSRLAGTALVSVAALTAVTGLREIYESDEARALEPTPTAADLLALVDHVIAFVRAGLAA